MNKNPPNLADLGLDQPVQKSPLDSAFINYVEPVTAKTWVDSIKLNEPAKFNSAIAALLSFVVPGAGQAYKMHIFSAFFWIVSAILIYIAAWPIGIAWHLACVLFAAFAKK